MQWHKSSPIDMVGLEPQTNPMRVADLEMAECLRRINLLTMADSSQSKTLKEVLFVLTKYMTNRANGADDTAMHDLKYTRMLCDMMLDRLEGMYND